MATCDYPQAEIMTLRIFGGQDDSVLDVMQSISADTCEVVTFDYLQDCVNSLESKDSGVYVSSRSADSSYTNLHLSNSDDSCKTAELCGADMNFIKIEYVSLDNESQSATSYERNIECLPKSQARPELLDLPKTLTSDITHLSKPMTDSTCIDRECMNEKNEPIHNKSNVPLEKDTGKCNQSFDANKNPQRRIRLLNNNYDGNNLEAAKASNLQPYLCLNSKKVESPNIKGVALSVKNKEAKKDADISDKQVKACEQCDMTFKYKRHLDRHLEGHQKNNCPHCNEKFARRKHLEVHLFRVHGERSTKHPHVCDICSRGFPKRTLLEWHKAKHALQHETCSECGATIESESGKRIPSDKQRKRKYPKCVECIEKSGAEERTFPDNGQIRDDRKCTKCEIAFASKKKASEHFKAVHSAVEDGTGKSDGVYFCTDCRHKFQKKDDYARHLQSASHLSKASEEMLVRGIFSCSVCSKELISRRALDQHVRRIHKGDKRFSCDIYGCTFQCARRTDLDRHRHLHVEERNVICEHCGKTFTSVSILNDHVLYVHNKERQFICEECGKAFKRNSLLKRHKLSHQQLRPFACMQCSTAFKRSHHLTRHMESCHRITLEKKKKVVKLMKTEGGHLVPVPEKPKKLRYKKMKMKSVRSPSLVAHSTATDAITDANTDGVTVVNSGDSSGNPNSPEELLNLLTAHGNAPQVLSLVDVNSGQVLTVEVADQEALPANSLMDQLDANCNETLDLPNYQDLEFHNAILSADQNYYDQTSYLELPLENVDGPLLSDAYGSKVDSLSTMESYFTQPFPSFLNL